MYRHERLGRRRRDRGLPTPPGDLARGLAPRRSARLLRGAVAAFILAAAASGGAALISAPAQAAVPGVTVVDNQLYKDGVPFLPRGFNMVGVLAPDGCTKVPGEAAAARASFGTAELSAARIDWYANLVRFQVSERGLDPTDVMYRPSYLDRIRSGVALAEREGLAVILSMQDQSQSCGSAHPLPFAATKRAWTTLAPPFLTDPNVMFELFNEPYNASTPEGWAQWRDGGSGPLDDQGQVAVGHQALVNVIRGLGSTNVLIADGANYAGQLQGLALLSDTLSIPQIAYGVHPYSFHLTNASTLKTDQANWDMRFGYLVATAPLIATEWNASASDCTVGVAARVSDFLSYLQVKKIGLLGHAFDIHNTMVKDLTTWQPTTMDGFGCNVRGADAGQVVQAHFADQAAGDPPTPDVTAPTARLTAPAEQATVGGVVTATADVADDVGVTAVQLLVDGSSVGLQATAPFTPAAISWNSAATVDGPHTLQAEALDAAGNVGRSQTITVSVDNADHAPPSAVAGLTATVGGPNDVDLSWQSASDNVAVTGYNVYRDGGWIVTLGTPNTTYSDAVSTGAPHAYQVEAFDAAGNVGPMSASVEATSADTTPPAQVLDVTVKGVTAHSVSLQWPPVTDDVGVTSYEVYRDGLWVGTPADGSGFVDSSLADAHTYTYTISALDAAGNTGALSKAVSATTVDATRPTVPANLTVLPIAPTEVAVSWSAADDNVAVVGYRVYRDGNLVGTSPQAGYRDSDLRDGATYTYTVTSYDAAGNESASSTATTVTLPDVTAPTAPGKPVAVLQSGSVNLTWTAAAANVGVTSFKVMRNGKPLSTVTKLSYTDTAVQQGKTYTYAVTATDAAHNVGPASAAATVKVPDTFAPTAPTNVKGTGGSHSVTLTWSPATDNVAVAGYEVFRGGKKIATVTGTTYANTGLTSGTSYTYKIRAFDTSGKYSPLTAGVTVKAR